MAKRGLAIVLTLSFTAIALGACSGDNNPQSNSSQSPSTSPSSQSQAQEQSSAKEILGESGAEQANSLLEDARKGGKDLLAQSDDINASLPNSRAPENVSACANLKSAVAGLSSDLSAGNGDAAKQFQAANEKYYPRIEEAAAKLPESDAKRLALKYADALKNLAEALNSSPYNPNDPGPHITNITGDYVGAGLELNSACPNLLDSK